VIMRSTSATVDVDGTWTFRVRGSPKPGNVVTKTLTVEDSIWFRVRKALQSCAARLFVIANLKLFEIHQLPRNTVHVKLLVQA
jgi:hypothetical protein